MATSGTYTLTPARNDIIRAALRKIGAISSGAIVNPGIISDVAFALNAMIKSWEAIGIHLWTQTNAILFTQPGQVKYVIGPNSTDHVAPDWNTTFLDNNYPETSTNIGVTSVTNINVGDTIGILVDEGTIFWTTVLNIVGTGVVLNAPLPDSATLGNPVYFYPPYTQIRPLRMPYAQRRQLLPQIIDTPMIRLARKDYEELPNKFNTGTITQFYYDPLSLTDGNVYLWPAPSDSTNNALWFTFYRPIQNFDTAANTADLPDEWVETIIFNLAKTIGPEFDCPSERYAIISARADELLELLKGWDREPESINFGVDFSQMMGRLGI